MVQLRLTTGECRCEANEGALQNGNSYVMANKQSSGAHSLVKAALPSFTLDEKVRRHWLSEIFFIRTQEGTRAMGISLT